jgi:23S rRNA pseudouridine2604 synthase
MCAALGYTVLDLERIRFMNIHLGNLEEGAWRKLTNKEHDFLMNNLGKKNK